MNVLTRMLHRPDPEQWKSRKESRRELRTRNTVLGWRRAPRTDHIVDPNSLDGRHLGEHFNALRMDETVQSLGRVEDEVRLEQWSKGPKDEPQPEPVTVALVEADEYYNAEIPLEEAVRRYRPKQGGSVKDALTKTEAQEDRPSSDS